MPQGVGYPVILLDIDLWQSDMPGSFANQFGERLHVFVQIHY